MSQRREGHSSRLPLRRSGNVAQIGSVACYSRRDCSACSHRLPQRGSLFMDSAILCRLSERSSLNTYVSTSERTRSTFIREVLRSSAQDATCLLVSSLLYFFIALGTTEAPLGTTETRERSYAQITSSRAHLVQGAQPL